MRTKLVSLQDPPLRFTVVDTPGQEIFYRMRNYGTDTALAMVRSHVTVYRRIDS